MSVIEVAVAPGNGPGMFRVEVVRSPAGEASALVSIDLDALLRRRAELQHAVLASSVIARRALSEAESCVREVGQTLFTALLGTGDVAGRYRASAAVAAARGERLRAVLRLGDPMLACLPWEAMYDEVVGSYVCRRDQLVRHIPVPAVADPLTVASPVRILGVVSSPRELPTLDVVQEKKQLTRALAQSNRDGLAEMVWAPSATWPDLQDLLLGGQWDVVHFIGHGHFDSGRDEGVLALTGKDGRPDLIEASRIVDLLRQARPMPRLVVLNSCSGAASSITDLFSGTAAALVRGGVSAVAAMQYAISDRAAVAFARGFYGAVARGHGIDDALTSGRVSILGMGSETLEWITPVLYLRGSDGHLFSATTSEGQHTVKGSEPGSDQIKKSRAAQDRAAPPVMAPGKAGSSGDLPMPVGQEAGLVGSATLASHDPAHTKKLSLAELQDHLQPRSLPKPIRNPPTLPLAALEPEAFERLVAEMVSSWGSPTVHFYGRRGQRQFGLDIYEEQPGGTRVLYQVRKYAKITCADIRAAITDYAGPPRRHPSSEPRERRFNPQRFILVTSAPVDDDTAKVDLIAKLQREYRGDIELAVWGTEAISRRLRESPNLVFAVFGESWAREYCGASKLAHAQKDAKTRKRVDETLLAAMAAQYARDNEIRFRQVELNGITVDSLFVDVPVSSHPGSQADDLLRQINPTGRQAEAYDRISGRSPIAAQAGAAQVLLHPKWTGSAVIVGGPGQGKTTLLQFLCQFHRARMLGRSEYSPIAAGLEPVSDVLRTPIRLELSEYAEWRRSRLGRSRSGFGGQDTRRQGSSQTQDTTLESYIAQVVADASARSFTARDLSVAVTSRPLLIALDGLDEVADAGERDQVADQIRITQSRLLVEARDMQIVVATRPGSVGRPIWRDSQFTALFLNQLTSALRMKYLERWTLQSRLTEAEIHELKSTFIKSITMPHVVELAGNPMQLAILLHLMQRRAVLPEKRTTLYERYIDVFMDRESKSAIVAENKDLILAFHKLLAWHIHTRVELGQSKGTVTLEELQALLTQYLVPRGRDVGFINELFKSVTMRVLCLVQRDLDSREFMFEVQPLREFFAAEHIFDSLPNITPKNTRPACLGSLLRYPYWSNVMRFFAGKLTSGEVPAMIYVLREMQQDRQIGAHPISRVAAKLLLDDQVLAGQVELVIKDMVHVILDSPGVVLALDGLLQQEDSLLRFQEYGGAKQAVQVLTEIMARDNATDSESAAKLAYHLGAQNHAKASWWAMIRAADPAQWLRTAAVLHALDGLKSQQIEEVARLITALDYELPTLELLISAHSDAMDDKIVRRCIDELKYGLDLRSQINTDNPFSRLATASSAAQFYQHTSNARTREKQASAKPPSASATKLHASEREGSLAGIRSRSVLFNAHVGTLENAHSRYQDWSTREAWSKLFDTVAEVWSEDCWPIREALLALPEFAYPPYSESAAITASTSWRDLACWHSTARDYRGNLDWWRMESRRFTDELATMTFVAAALTTASSTVVQKLTDDLNVHLEWLTRRRWIAISAALSLYIQSKTDRNDLNLGDLLRTRRMKPTGRLAVLLWHVSRQARDQLEWFLINDVSDLWNSGPSVRPVLRSLIKDRDQVLTIEHLRGSRFDIPEGELKFAKFKGMTYKSAIEILEDPHPWPTDIVRLAAEHLGRKLAKQAPVSAVADENDWRV